jgi:hypothetical protein
MINLVVMDTYGFSPLWIVSNTGGFENINPKEIITDQSILDKLDKWDKPVSDEELYEHEREGIELAMIISDSINDREVKYNVLFDSYILRKRSSNYTALLDELALKQRKS